jgi:hypothetical protein
MGPASACWVVGAEVQHYDGPGRGSLKVKPLWFLRVIIALLDVIDWCSLWWRGLCGPQNMRMFSTTETAHTGSPCANA